MGQVLAGLRKGMARRSFWLQWLTLVPSKAKPRKGQL